MTKSNGIKSLKQAAKLLNKHAPDGESLAYINPEEGRLLKAHGGSGIMTLQGVPTYGAIWDFAKKFVPDAWEPALETIGTGIQSVGKFLGYGDKEIPHPTKKGQTIIQPGRSIVNDALSVWGALRAKKDQEGLNEAEMAQFNKLNEQLMSAQTEFAANVGQGPQVTNVPTTIEDVSTFTDVTLPTMKTTAVAEGGRIGYSSGTEDGALKKTYNKVIQRKIKMLQGMKDSGIEISAEDDKWLQEHTGQAQGGRIGYNLGGIGAMDPRMGYQVGSSDIPGIPGVGKAMRDVDFPTFSEGVNQEFPSNELGAIDTTVQEDVSTTGGNQIQETVMALINSGTVENTRDAMAQAHVINQIEHDYPGVTKLVISLINSGSTEDIRETIQQAIMIMEGSKDIKSNVGSIDFSEFIPEGQAYGGRIGAQKGGIMPLLNLGGMEKDYRQDGGFVPIGRREKADDVPARLSKNEFVFTADAVRAAGGGDIDQGAQRMYNVMKNLEAGGEISEQSQGKA